MTTEGVDYSFTRPSASILRLFGKRFVCRYLTSLHSSKLITASEANNLTADGMFIVLGYEDTAGRANDGYAEGLADAEVAGRLADGIGCPPDRPIYFAVDWDVTWSGMARVAEYFKGVSAHLGFYRVGIYGGYTAVDYAYTEQIAKWYWQTYAWSGGRTHFATHIYQYSNGHALAGGEVDYDRALQADYGGWQVGHYVPPDLNTNLPNITEDSSWDYAAQISGAAADVGGRVTSLANITAAINALRN